MTPTVTFAGEKPLSAFADPSTESGDHFRYTNLLNTLDELRALMVVALDHENFTDAFLFACGMQQVTDDYADDLPILIERAATVVDDSDVVGRRIVGDFIRRSGIVLAGAGREAPLRRRVRRRRAILRELVAHLARLVVDSADTDAAMESARLVGLMADHRAGVPSKCATTLARLPSCFRSFDQRPGDVHEVVDRFTARFPDRNRAIGVVGIRTSGSYLAPLYTASLRVRGFTTVSTCTTRPGHPMIGQDAEVVHQLASRGGLALIADDPPETGNSVAAVAREVHRLGVPDSAIVLLLPLFGDADAVPPVLHGRPAVVLPWREWEVHQHLAAASVARDLHELLPAVNIRNVERVPLPAPRSERGHTHALYRVQFDTGPAVTTPRVAEVVAEGVGYGYLGEHALAIAAALPDHVPAVYGVRNGLLYREWLPETDVLRTRPRSATFAATAAEYFAARRDALPVDGDRSIALVGQNPVWEIASNMLSRTFARGWRIARVVAVDRAARRLLAVERPSVVDGDVDVRRWFTDADTTHIVKANFADGAFSHLDLECFDADFDVAALAASVDEPAFSSELREEYSRRAQHPIAEERWVLYQLVHIWDMARRGLVTPTEARERESRAVRRFFATLFFDDVTVPPDGPLCAFDVDGVVETDALGFSTPTAAAAVALRACTRHGFRPVLVSGRSLDELRDRCDTYRLAGCVAEYGAVVYDRVQDVVRGLLSPGELEALARVREALESVDGVVVEPGHRFSVRSSVVDASGGTRSLPEPVTAAAVRAACPHQVRAIRGDAQTDFVIARVDKARGLEALVTLLGPAGVRTALAVGDSEPDVPVLELADRACVPAHARSIRRKGRVEVTRHRYQVGLAEAVTGLIGHAPGSCPECAPEPSTPDARLLLSLISAQEASPAARVGRLLALAWSAAR